MDNFKKSILNINKQFSAAALTYFNLAKLKNAKPDIIVIVGMGGSGQIGDLIMSLAEKLKISVPILTWKDYGLPTPSHYKKPLYIFVSFSGNTQETLSGLKNSGLKAVICSGGKLREWARKNHIPSAIFSPNGLVPRQAGGYMFYGAINIIKTIFKNVQLPSLIHINPKKFEKEGQKIAQELKGKTILIYASSQNNYLAYNWKTRLNETAKALSFIGTFPEMSHNEIVPFEKHFQNLSVVFLNDSQDHPQNKKKIHLISKILKNNGIKTIKIDLIGNNRLEKTWQNLILADWTSYYLAKINKVNPKNTKLIDQLKKLMQ